MTRSLLKPKKTVDLHTAAFIDDLDAYEIDELLGRSITRLREQLDAAIYWEYSEIKFIHGKGQGILRNAVYTELRLYQADGMISHFYPSYSNPDVVVVVLGL